MKEIGQGINQNNGRHNDDIFYMVRNFVQQISQAGTEHNGEKKHDDKLGQKTHDTGGSGT